MANSKYDGIKIGQIAQNYLIDALQNGNISTAEIEEFLDRNFSRQTFGLGYSLLSVERRIDDKGRARDYAKPITINGKKYFLCSQWREEPSRDKLITWLDDQGGATGSQTSGSATAKSNAKNRQQVPIVTSSSVQNAGTK